MVFRFENNVACRRIKGECASDLMLIFPKIGQKFSQNNRTEPKNRRELFNLGHILQTKEVFLMLILKIVNYIFQILFNCYLQIDN